MEDYTQRDIETENKGKALKRKTLKEMEWLLSKILSEKSRSILLDEVSPLRYSFMLEEVRETKSSKFLENLTFMNSKRFKRTIRNVEPHLSFIYIYMRLKGKFIANPDLNNLADLNRGIYLATRLQRIDEDTDWKETLPRLPEELEEILSQKKSLKKGLVSFTDQELNLLSSCLTYSYELYGDKFWETGSSIRWQIEGRVTETKEGYSALLEEFLETYSNEKKLITSGEKTPEEVLDTLSDRIRDSMSQALDMGSSPIRVFSYRCLELSRDLAKIELLRNRQDSRLDKAVSAYQKRKLRAPLQEEASKKKHEIKEYLDLHYISLKEQVDDWLSDATPFIYIARELDKYRLEKKFSEKIPELSY